MNQDKTQFQSVLAVELTDFLKHQRSLGKRFLNEERALHLFDGYLVDERIGTLAAITPALIDAFLASRPRSRPRSYNHLLSVCSNGWSALREARDRKKTPGNWQVNML